MSGVHCPGCGAKNREASVKCRICGNDLRGLAEQPTSRPTPGRDEMRSSSLLGFVALATLGVGAIVLGGVVVGVLPGGDVLTSLRNRVPFLASETEDGWEEFTQPPARFAATMPVDRRPDQVAFPSSTTGTLDEWVSTLGPDDDPETVLTVGWTTVPTPASESVEATLTSTALAWAGTLGGEVTGDEQTSFQGQPALVVKVSDVETPGGDDATIKALLVRRRDQLLVVSSRSVYPDHPQFDRLVNGVTLL